MFRTACVALTGTVALLSGCGSIPQLDRGPGTHHRIHGRTHVDGHPGRAGTSDADPERVDPSDADPQRDQAVGQVAFDLLAVREAPACAWYCPTRTSSTSPGRTAA